MDDTSAFLVGILPEDEVAKITAATNLPADVVTDGLAFEKLWTDRGIPATQDGMAARTMLVQASVMLSLGMGVPDALLGEYVVAALAATRQLSEKHGAQAGVAQASAVAHGVQQPPVEGDEDDDEDEDGEEGDEDDDDAEVEEEPAKP